MKIKSGIKVFLVTLGVIVAASVYTVPASASDTAKKVDPMQIARGAQEWRDHCGRCHNLRDPKEFTDSKWSAIVSQMRTRANLPGKVERDITAFLKASN